MAHRYPSLVGTSSSSSSSAAAATGGTNRLLPSSRTPPRDLTLAKTTKRDGSSRNLGAAAIVRKLVSGSGAGGRPRPSARPAPIPISDGPIIADENKRSAGRLKASSHLMALHKKLFSKATSPAALPEPPKASTNTRTLAMVLRSERELANRNRECESEISELRRLLEERDREAEKLRNLCFKQREEIKALKDAILFPDDDVDRRRLCDILEKRGPKPAASAMPKLLVESEVLRTPGRKAQQYLLVDDDLAGEDRSSRETLSNNGIGSSGEISLMDFNPCSTP